VNQIVVPARFPKHCRYFCIDANTYKVKKKTLQEFKKIGYHKLFTKELRL
jgi:hypothetical protein